MKINNAAINRYAEEHTTPESALLKRINRETYSEVMRPRMLAGHLQGRFLAMISRMLHPRAILEIGTYTGYSALCLAEGLAPAGRLTTIDINKELEGRVRNYFHESGMESHIDYLIGDAVLLVPRLAGPFDLVFIDADKENYSAYFDMVIAKVPPGGCIVADNVLWDGKILDAKPDRETQALQEFNSKVYNDPRIDTTLLPFRDGLMLMLKN